MNTCKLKEPVKVEPTFEAYSKCLEFTLFCQKNPSLKFWEALQLWIETKHDKRFKKVIVFVEDDRKKTIKLYDTKNWSGKDDPRELFANELKLIEK